MKLPLSTLLWRNFFAPLCIIALCGILVIHFYGSDNPSVTAAIWIACSVGLGIILNRGEALPGKHRATEEKRRAEILKNITPATSEKAPE